MCCVAERRIAFAMATTKSVAGQNIAFKRFYRIHADLTPERQSRDAAGDRAVKTFTRESIATRRSYLGRMGRIIVHSCLRPVDRVRSFSESVPCFRLRTHWMLAIPRTASDLSPCCLRDAIRRHRQVSTNTQCRLLRNCVLDHLASLCTRNFLLFVSNRQLVATRSHGTNKSQPP